MKIAIGPSSFSEVSDTPIKYMEKNGLIISENPYKRRLSKKEIIDHLQGCEGLIAGLEPLDKEVLQKNPQLKVISRVGVGLDNIDLDFCQKNNIKVLNTPNAQTLAVAELCLSILLYILRDIHFFNQNMHQGKWVKKITRSVKGLNIFFIGYGKIAKKFAELLKPLEANILFFDPYEKGSISLEEGLKNADVVTLHSSDTEMILNKNTMPFLKKGVILMNSARGHLIDEDMLYEMLASEYISCAWLDVFSEEPYTNKLNTLENIILTPHISSYTQQCRMEMEMEAVENLINNIK